MIGDEREIARLLRLLPPAPLAWVQAAQELGAARAAIDEIVTLAAEDAALRARVVADLEAALEAHGVEPTPAVVEVLRVRLDAGS
jgi:hypothetical protein